MDPWARLMMIARGQHGAVSLEQAVEAGIAERTWRRRTTDERWHRPFPGVAIAPSGRLDFPARTMAALLAVGQPALASHWTAAHLLGISDLAPSDIDVLLPADRWLRPVPGIRVTRTRSYPERHRQVGRIPVTIPARTVVDLASRLRVEREFRPLLIQAVQRRGCTLAQIEALLDEMGRVAGRAMMRQVLRQLATDRCDSELEFQVRKGLRAEGLNPAPAPVPLRLRNGRTIHVDIGFPPLPVGVEVDGRAFHSSAQAVAKDHRRQNSAQAVGYQMLRITWLRMDRDWEGFVEELRWNLDAARQRTG